MKYLKVSVPIRGLFNLTIIIIMWLFNRIKLVSVPIRGLFNLTRGGNVIEAHTKEGLSFRPHQGII